MPQNDGHQPRASLGTVADRVDGVLRGDGVLEFKSGLDV